MKAFTNIMHIVLRYLAIVSLNIVFSVHVVLNRDYSMENARVRFLSTS